MKKYIMVLITVVMLMSIGCASLPEIGDRAYSVGRHTVIAYALAEDKIPKEKKQAIYKLWLVLDSLITGIQQGNVDIPTDMKGEISKLIDAKLSDPKQKQLAYIAFSELWNKLNRRFDVDNLQDMHTYYILKCYRDGVADALSAYIDK
jgi:hypothetical protein